MTRKVSNNHPNINDVLQSACYDFSYFDYNRLRCRNSTAHPRYIRRSSRFLHLDDFCNADESALQLFLKINGIALNKRINNKKSISLMTRSKMPRTRTASVCEKLKHSPLLPGSDSGHWLRNRRHTTFNNSCLDNSGDDDSNQVKPMRELRSTTKSLLKSLEHEHNTWESGRPKRTCLRQKRISADERLVADNRTYYKVEVIPNKLRSSGVTNREIEISKKLKTPPTAEDSEDDKGKFRKLRNSEITRLNDEAENFLFPRKSNSNAEEEVPAENQISKSLGKSINSDKTDKINKHVHEEETSMDSISSELSVTHKKRRLTQAEAFILDNQEYYKFETPGSRLRYQGSYLSPVATKNAKNNGEYSTKQTKKELATENKPKINLEDVKFSFEVVPTDESWYTTFQRQDKGEESYITHNEPGFFKPFLVPYELGLLPSLDPRYCIYNYNQVKKRFLQDTIASTSNISSCKSDSSSNPTSSKIEADANSAEETVIEHETTNNSIKKPRYLPRQSAGRKAIYVPTKNPRKSPRQHASTLAILSSLLHQRKRHKVKGSPHRASKRELPSIVEEDKEAQELENYEAIAKNINNVLSGSMEQLEQLNITPSDCVHVNLHCEPNAVDSLEDFINTENEVTNSTNSKSPSDSAVRKTYRKKKKNRTGWPNKNKKVVFRKEGSDSRDGLGGSEHSNSIANSPSAHADSEENSVDSLANRCNFQKQPDVENAISNVNKGDEQSEGDSKVNGDVPVNKLNGMNDSFELSFRSLGGTPKRKEHRESSSDNCAEVVVASVGDKIDCVNVDLAKWESAERVLTAKLRSESLNNDTQFQPIVRVQKLESGITVNRVEKRPRHSPSPKRTRPRRSMPASPKSPRMLRKPRGGWYRERY